MSLQSNSGNGLNLAQFVTRSLNLASKEELDEFLRDTDARDQVRAAAYQDLFIVIKNIGLADSLGLLKLTTAEQWRGFVDLDCWRKDSAHLNSLLQWIAASVRCGPEETARMARAIDPNLLALLLKETVEVYFVESDELLPDLPLIFTPDQRFGIHVILGGEKGSLSRFLLDAVFRFDPSLGYDLMDRLRWENRVSLEEEAYQEKTRRLEEIGFVDYYEALEIYSAEPVADRCLGPDSRADGDKAPVSTALPAMLVASLHPGQYLLDGLQRISEPERIERIRQSFAALANRLLSVHSVTPSDLEKVQPALEEIRDNINLALEYLTDGHTENATDILLKTEIPTLFKRGFGLVARLRIEAERILSLRDLRLSGCDETLLDSLDQEFLDGVRRFQPRFFEGLEDSSKRSYRNFRSLRDIQLAQRKIEEINFLEGSFWLLFENGARSALELSLRTGVLNLKIENVRFRNIFCTALAQFVRCRSFNPEPLTAEEILELASSASSDAANLRGVLVESGRQAISARIPEGTARRPLFRYCSDWIPELSGELRSLEASRPPDPLSIRSVLMRT